jgi:hypothetical protein
MSVTRIHSVKLPRQGSNKDPNDFERAGVLDSVFADAMAEAKAKERDAFPFCYADELADVEPEIFLIDDWLPRGGTHVLYAPKDCLKSFVAVDWFLSVVAGVPWHGFDVEQGPGVYIAGEGNIRLRKRFLAWCIRHNMKLADLPLVLSKWPMQVLDAENIEQWATHIKQAEGHFGSPVKFIIVDTLATNFGPGDENAPTDMARFLVNRNIHLKRETEATILVVHHCGKDATRGARGGSSIEMNAENVFELTRDVQKGEEWSHRVTLNCKHTKDGAKPEGLRFKGVPVELGIADRRGEQITSLVLEPELTERETAVMNNTMAGRSQRQIAGQLGVTRTVIARIQARLRSQKWLP